MRAGLRAGALAVLLALPGVAAAQPPADGAPSGESAAEERAMAFEAAEGARTENVPGGTLLIVAYGVVWLLVLGYVVSLGYRQARTRDEIQRLRQDLAATERAGDD
mgnify:CR=1 FL=1